MNRQDIDYTTYIKPLYPCEPIASLAMLLAIQRPI